ncbi:hypothetical protein [Actinoplanes sp. NPDC051494]|uniref:hypothetical protein n=1 Tax=Actinoplanes sp. NPDC051494 TaxID=3363907 RepID=UPI0037A93DD6
MAGLLSLTLLKINDLGAARQWGRTARIAAAECGDPATRSWVWAQEAYRYFYAGETRSAIAAAERAQEQAGPGGGVGAALAAALEARARAAIGDAAGTQLALGRAEELLADLGTEQTSASALGYDEAQLRFHAGNAYTHLGDSASAWAAQDRAMQLYPEFNYLDRTLVHLDRAACLIHGGDFRAGSIHVQHVLSRLTADQHDRLVVTRAEAVLSLVPAIETSSSAVRDAHDYLATISLDNMEFPR